MKSFPSSLRYKIHVKDEHKGVEPMENYDPEKCVQPDDFICLICIKKFKNRNGLKLHIQNFHLAGSSLKHLSDEKEVPDKEEEDKAAEEKVAAAGEKAEGKSEAAEGKSEASDEKDPLADPLADPLDTSQDETKEEAVSKSDEKKEEPSEKSTTQVEEQSQNISENKEESSKEANASIEDKKDNSEEISSKDGEADERVKKDGTENKETPMTVDEEGESKKAAGEDENKSKSTEGEGVAKVTEIINLENGTEDSEKKSDSDSTKEVQKNGDGGSKDDDEIMIIGSITQRTIASKISFIPIDSFSICFDFIHPGEQTPVKVVKAPTNPLKTVSARDEMLIKKMLELLKKYGCEFCDRRFDTKFALSHHERSVLVHLFVPSQSIL